jgi:hypothetical protein
MGWKMRRMIYETYILKATQAENAKGRRCSGSCRFVRRDAGKWNRYNRDGYVFALDISPLTWAHSPLPLRPVTAGEACRFSTLHYISPYRHVKWNMIGSQLDHNLLRTRRKQVDVNLASVRIVRSTWYGSDWGTMLQSGRSRVWDSMRRMNCLYLHNPRGRTRPWALLNL